MRIALAIFIPWLQFFTIGRPWSGFLCLFLQITLIGWIPAALWSVYALSQYMTEKKINESPQAHQMKEIAFQQAKQVPNSQN